jgi:hypothetical protein
MIAATSKAVAFLLQLWGAVTLFRATRKPKVPVGYQDEQGFHYGVKPAEKQIIWPPVD